jgi:predicted Zn-dependent peptidase
MLDRSVTPPIRNAATFDIILPDCKKFILDNGIPVIVVDAGVEEVIQIEWVFEAGNAMEGANMVAAATNHLIRNGTTARTAFDISEQIDFYGAFLSRSCFNETSVITLHSLTKHLEKLLPVITDIFTDSIFPQEELDIFKQNSRQRLSVNLRKCDFVANREMDALIYGKDHPYGKYSTFEAIDALYREQIIDFYDKCYRNGNMVIFVSGKLPGTIIEQLNGAFGHLPFRPYKPGGVYVEVPASPSPEQRVVRIENDPSGVQGAIRLARHAPNRRHPDFQKLQVLNTLFGGFFGSRLMDNIREDKGYTYGIHSFIQNHIGNSAWMITTEAGREVCEAAIKEVYFEMQQLREGFIDDEELLLVRNYMIGTILGSLDGPFQIAARWKGYYLNGIEDGKTYFDDAIRVVKTVSSEELRALADEWLQPSHFYEMVVV